MQVFTASRQAASRVVSAALEFCADVRVTDQSGSDPLFVVEFDDRVVMNDDERAAVARCATGS